MAGIFVIISSITGFTGSLLLWLSGLGFLMAALTGYGLAGLLFLVLVLRESRGAPVPEDFTLAEDDFRCEAPAGASVRH